MHNNPNSDRHRLQWNNPHDFSCNKYIWIHHLNQTEINSFHAFHKINPWDSTIFVQNNGIVHVNNTGCGKMNGLPKFRKNILKSLKIVSGANKYDASFIKSTIDFTKSVRPPCNV